jgi:hypothetical protein
MSAASNVPITRNIYFLFPAFFVFWLIARFVFLFLRDEGTANLDISEMVVGGVFFSAFMIFVLAVRASSSGSSMKVRGKGRP